MKSDQTILEEAKEYEIKVPTNGLRHSIRDYLSAKGTFSRKSHRGERRIFVLYDDAVKSAYQFTGQELAIELAKLKAEIAKYVHHWDLYFNSPKVGQPPSIDDLRKLLTPTADEPGQNDY